MKEYLIKKAVYLPDGNIDWNQIDFAEVNFSPWQDYASPYNTLAQVVYDGEGLYVHLQTDERKLRAVNTEKNSIVCEDSCMELFFSPDSNDTRYFNIEINPLGTMLVYVSNGRDNFEHIEFDEETFNVKSVITYDGWELYYKIPYSFIRKHFKNITDIMYGNFYKCGDKTYREHYGCWNPVEIEYPEFHCRQYFGKLIFEDMEGFV